MTARELVFFIRAEDQASRVIRKVAKDLGSLSSGTKLKDVQAAATRANVAAEEKLARAQQVVLRNQVALRDAQTKQVALQQRVNQLAADWSSVGKANLDIARAQLGTQQQRVAYAERELQLATASTDKARSNIAAVAASGRLAEAEFNKATSVTRWNRLASAIHSIGRVAQLAGIVMVASFGAAAVSAAKFQTQLTLAATQARQPGQSSASVAGISTRLNAVVLQQMKQFPASSADMADSLYQIFSSTNITKIADAAKLLRTFNQMAVAGGTDLKTMTDAGITLYNNFGGVNGEFKNMTQAGNAFFAAVRYGRMNAEQFALSLGNIVPIAKTAGLSFKDVADAMAILTRQSGSRLTSRDATGLARLIEVLNRPEMIAGLKTMGVQVLDTSGKMRPLLSIMQDIAKSTKDMTPNQALNFFKQVSAAGGGAGSKGFAGTIQARRAFAYLLNDIKQYSHVSGEVNKDNDELIKSFEAMSKSPGVKWTVFINNMKALAITMGEQVIPVFIRFSQPLIHLLKYFNSLSDGTKHTIATIGGSIGVFALLGGTLATFVVGPIVRLIGLLKLLRGVSGLSSLSSEAGFARVGLLGLMGVLGLLAFVLIKYPNQVHSVVNALGGLRNVLKLITILGVSFAVARILTSLTLIRLSSMAAAAEVGALQKSLLAIRLMGPIAVVITVLIYKKEIDKFGSGLVNSIKGHLSFLSGVPGFGDILTPNLNDSQRKAVKNAKELIKEAQGLGLDITNPKYKKTKDVAQNARNEVAAYQKAAEKAKALINTKDKVGQTYIDIFDKKPLVSPKISKGSPITGLTNAEKAARAAKDAARATAVVQKATFQQELVNVARLQKTKDRSVADYKKYFDAITKLQKDSTAAQWGYAQDFLSKETSATKKGISEATKAAKASAKELGNAYSNIMSSYQTFLQQNQTNYGSVFQGPFMQSPLMQARLGFNNQSVRPQDVLKDLLSQNSQFNKLNSQINRIQKRGGPQSLIQQLRAAGPSALPDIEALNKLSPAQWKKYVAAWDAGQKSIKNATIAQLNQQLSIYKKFGSNVALQIIAGIKSEDPKLQGELEGLINKMFPSLVKKAAKAPATIPTGSKGSFAQVTHTHHTSHYSPHIHNPVTHDVDTSLKQDYFRNKVRNQ